MSKRISGSGVNICISSLNSYNLKHNPCFLDFFRCFFFFFSHQPCRWAMWISSHMAIVINVILASGKMAGNKNEWKYPLNSCYINQKPVTEKVKEYKVTPKDNFRHWFSKCGSQIPKLLETLWGVCNVKNIFITILVVFVFYIVLAYW